MSPRQTRQSHSDCDRFKARLQEVLDDRRDPSGDSELRGHAAACGPCARLLGLQDRLWNCVHRWALLSADAGERETDSGRDSRVDLFAPAPARSLAGRRAAGWSSGLVAIALALVAFIGLGVMRSSDESGWRRSSTAGSSGAQGLMRRTGRSTGLFAAGFTPKSRAKTAASGNRVPVGNVRIGPVGVESWVAQIGILNEAVADFPVSRISEVQEMRGVQELTDGMRPVAHSVGSVIQVLWRNLPATRGDSRENPTPDACSRIVRACVC